jgi:antitoxin component YwqK of YwqJK toxin-antitoxin module
MKPILLSAALFFSINLLFGQSKIYYDVFNQEIDSTQADHYGLTSFDSSRMLYEFEAFYLNNIRKSIDYYETDELKKSTGPSLAWYEKGQLSDSGCYLNDKRTGSWKFYFDNGQKSAEVTFENDEIIQQIYWNSDGSNHEDLTDVNVSPAPEGGLKNLYKYISDNLKYSKKSRRKGITGKLYVGFIVDKQGKINHLKIFKGLSKEIDEAAIQILQTMPDWNPGIQYNRIIDCRMVLPLVFNLK